MAADKETRVIEIILNGNKVDASIKEMKASTALLYNQLQKLPAGSAEFVKKSEEFQKVKQRLDSATASARGMAQASSFMGNAMSSALGFLTAGGIMGAISTVFNFFTSSKEKFESADASLKQMEATLMSTKHAAGLTSQEIQDLAGTLQDKTLFDADDTIGASGLLLTFTNIKKGIFEEALPAIQDMAQKMAGDGPADLKGATIQVGKALNDPIKGITALSKVGVSFTAEQKETIKTMVAMGDSAGAQALILKELQTEFGGSAEAARKAAGGGWKGFLLTMENVEEAVGEKVSGALDWMGNLLGEVFDKSGPLVAVFTELWNELGKMYDEIDEVISGLGLFNEEGSLAQGIVDSLVFVFKILVTPLKLTAQLVTGIYSAFKNLYNSSELVRGSLGGFAAAIVQMFTNVKNIVVNAFSGLADILEGVFTASPDKIRAGLKKSGAAVEGIYEGIGKGAADAFNKGYDANKNNLIETKAKGKKGEGGDSITPEEKAAAEKKALEEANARNEAKAAADKKAAEKRAKEEEKARKLAEKVAEEELRYKRSIEDLKLELIENNQLRETEKLMVHFRRKIEDLEGHENQITEQKLLLEQQRKIALDELQLKFEEEDKKKEEEKFLKEQEDNTLEEALAKETLEMLFLEGLLTEEQHAQAKYEQKRQFLQMEADLVAKHYGFASAEAMKANNAILLLDKEHHAAKVENEKKTTEAKKALQNAQISEAKARLQDVMDLLGKETGARKIAATAMKTFALSEIMVKGTEEIQAIWLNANSNPLNKLIPGAGYALAGIQTIAAVTRRKKAMDEVAMQTYAGGGATGDGISINGFGKMVDHTGHVIAGVVHDNEYVSPKWMYQNPKYARTFAWLEAERRKGPGFAEGVSTSAPANISTPTSDANQMVSENILLMAAKFDQFRLEISQWQRELEVNYDPFAATNADQKAFALRKKASL